MIKEIKNLFIILALVQFSSQCGEGCLMCSTDTVCELCDTSNAYILDQEKCVRKPLANCVSYNSEGRCKTCARNFYLQETTNTCVEVENFNIIENCLSYNTQSLCEVCDKDFYLGGIKCIGVDLKIESCLEYNTSKTCSRCSEGFLVSINGKRCLQIEETTNCQSYSLNSCTQCNENSLFERNQYYEDQLKMMGQDLTGLNLYMTLNYYQDLPTYYREFCIKTQVPNCLEFSDYKTCTKCMTGYFLSENVCKENPKNFISNCKAYRSAKECIECVNGFYLEQPTKCIKVDEMEGCLIYDGKVSFSSCIRCTEDKFLQTSTTCAIRTKPVIENCALLAPTTDNCLTCADKFLKTSDSLKCLPLIENCVQYDPNSSESSDVMICQKCLNGFYLQNNVCTLGTVENCEVLQISEDKCEKCMNKYYLLADKCKLHPQLSYCMTYNPLTVAVCDQCQVGTQQFTQSTYCNPVNQIKNCTTYSDVNTCSKCEDMYNLKENKCLVIDMNLHCLYMDNDVCSKCKDGYYLKDNLCIEPLKNELLNCKTKGLIANGYQKCSSCEENAIAFEYPGHKLCFEYNEDFQQYTNTTSILPSNCKVVKLVSGVLKCQTCIEDYMILSTGECIEKDLCTGSIQRIVPIIQDNRIVDYQKNFCDQTTSTCKVRGLFLNTTTNTISTQCIKCNSGFDKIVDFNETKQIILTKDDLEIEYADSDTIYKKIVSVCEAFTLTKRRPTNIEVPLFDKCDLWYKFSTFGEKGCFKCAHLYYGEVENWKVNKCFTYDEQTKKCTKCMNDYSLSTDGLKCTAITKIDHCVWYKENLSTCQKCEKGYYLSNNLCLQSTEVQKCLNYSLNQNTCLECESTYHLYKNTSNQQFCIKPIYKCSLYRYITSNDDQVVCTKCADGYYPDSLEGCVKGTIKNCWQYEQVSQQNVCKQYINTIPFLSQNYCQRVTPITGCYTYKSKIDNTGKNIIVCDECSKDTHYKSGDICCPYGMFNNLGKCDYILVNECKNSTSALTCDTCNDFYYFDLYMNELSIPFKCCGIGTYWNPVASKCDKNIELLENNYHCTLYEKTALKSCINCQDGYYISNHSQGVDPIKNGYCCQEGYYYKYSLTKGHSCEPIAISNCIQNTCTYNNVSLSYLEAMTCTCTKCKTGYTLNGTGSAKVCCNDSTEYFDTPNCVNKPVGCDVVTAGKCTQCKSDYKAYFKVSQADGEVVCCNYKATPRQWYQELSQQTECTNQNGTSANNIAFTYSGDSNCILTNFDTTHSTINDASCTECVTGFSPSGFQSKKCCPAGKMWNGTLQECLVNKYFNDCVKVKILTSLTDPFCETCRNGYYLHNGVCVVDNEMLNNTTFEIVQITIENCKQASNTIPNTTPLECSQCKDGYTISTDKLTCNKNMMITVNSKQYYLPDFVKNCALFNIETNVCLQCTGSAQKYDSDLCCNENEKIVNNACVVETDATKLAELKATRILPGCVSMNNLQCVECDSNFILLDNHTCISVVDAQKQCDFNLINENCAQTTQAKLLACECDTCSYFAYKSSNVCCPYGTKYNAQLQKCERLMDPNCAKHDGTDCIECFHEPTKRLVLSNYTYKSVRADNYVRSVNATDEFYTVTPQMINANYYLSDKICCRKGSYNKNGQCISITVAGCQQAQLVSNVEQCTLCKKLKENPDANGACVAKTDLNDFYTPINHTTQIPKGVYWDYLTSSYETILDKNCNETDQKTYCKTCKDTYSLGNQIAKFTINLRGNQYHTGVYKEILVRLCHNNDTTKVLDQFKLRHFDKCQNWDPTTGKCTACQTGKYVTQGICCDEGKVVLNYEGMPYCTSISGQQTNCLSYEIDKGICNLCGTGFTATRGSCCADDTTSVTTKTSKAYINIFNRDQNCDIKPYYCKKYDQNTFSCLHCETGYSLANGQCIDDTKVIQNNTLKNTIEVYPGCNQLDVVGNCISIATGHYVHKGKACALGYYNDQKSTQCNTLISSLGDNFKTCIQLDGNNNCSQCNTTSYLSNNTCCLIGFYFDTFIKKCTAIQKYKNCKIAWVDKTKDCTECIEGHYLSRGFCVPEKKLAVDDIGTEQDIQIENCIQAQNFTTCQKCSGDQVIFDNKCQYYIDIDEDQRIGECLQIQTGSPPICLKCKVGKYLQDNNNCCSYGFYHNGQDCQSLETISKNCSEWKSGQCQKCLPEKSFNEQQIHDELLIHNEPLVPIELETYLSNQLACCPYGQFALSSTSCQPIQNLKNCQQTDSDVACNKCLPGFKNINGNCVQNDIQNCQIGKDNTLCLVCNDGFYLDEKTNLCTQQRVIPDCVQMEKNTNNCQECATNKFWDGYSCCSSGQVTIMTGLLTNQISCMNQSPFTNTECHKAQNQECTECKNGNRLTLNVCCPAGQFPVGGVCTVVIGAGLTTCKQYIDQTKCAYIEEDGKDVSCSENNYFTENRCCPNGTYWNGTACTQFADKLLNCKKLKAGACDECNDNYYLNHGQCIDSTNHYVLGVSAAITNTIPNCIQVDETSTFCIECAATYSLTELNRCCQLTDNSADYYFNPLTFTCVAVTAANGKYLDMNTGIIEECVVGTEFQTGGKCCIEGSLYNSVTPGCEAGTAGDNCALYDVKDTNNLSNCLKCKANFLLFSLNGTKTCESVTASKKKVYTDAYYDVADTTNYDKCTKKDDTDKCIGCNSSTNYLLFSSCPQYLKQFTSATDYTEIDVTVTDCKQMDPADFTKCKYCKADHTLNAVQDTCFLQNAYPVQSCIIEDATRSCTTCASDAQFYSKTEGQTTTTVCCRYFEEDVQNSIPFRTEVPSSDFTACQPFMFEINNCLQYDQTDNTCKKCKDDYYISNNGVCCQNGKYYDASNKKCADVSLNQCLQVSSSNCLKCIDDPNYYLSSDNCCQIGKFWNGTACTDLTDNCQKATNNSTNPDCFECNSTANLYATPKKCCLKTQWYNTGGSTCADNTIANCTHQTSTDNCKECQSGYTLYQLNLFNAAQTDRCCKNGTFFNYADKTCQDEGKIEEIESNCLNWDRKKLECTKCIAGTTPEVYLTNGRCCQTTEYFDVIINFCIPIQIITPTAPLVGCTQINNSNICIACTAGKYLRKSDSFCKTPDNADANCKTFDDMVEYCSVCNDGFYLHRQVCTAINSGNLSVSEVAITNCELYGEDSQSNLTCTKCQESTSTYITNNYQTCCPYNQYYKTSAAQCETSTEFPNCQQFPLDTPHDCLKCDKGYFLAILKDGLKRCIKFSTPDQECLLSEIGVTNTKNTFSCTKCKNQGKEYVLLPESLTKQIFIDYDPIQNCEQYETTNLLSTSSLKCLRCIHNDINYLTITGGNQQCVVRTLSIGELLLSNCTDYQPDRDDCIACKEGYYLFTETNTQKKRCMKNPDNCRIYHFDSINVQNSYCAACIENFVLAMIDNVLTCIESNNLVQVEAKAPRFYPGYIKKCEFNQDCQQKYLGGLEAQVEKLYSCHLCKYQGYIPFVSVRTNGVKIEGLQRYKKPSNVNDTQDLEGGFVNSRCMRVSGETFGIDDGNFNFPQNCALGIINSNLPAVSDSTFQNAQKVRLGIYCSACKPGYRPMKSNVWNDLHHVYSCEFISNCLEKGNNFNECDKCEDKYVFLYESEKVQKNKCVEFNQDLNCQVVQQDNGVTTCRYCKEGYSFNYDGVCEKLYMKGICKEDSLEKLALNKRPTVKEVDFAIERFDHGHGCDECSDDQFMFYLEDTTRSLFCTNSQYIEEKELIQNTKYDNLCRHYIAQTDSILCSVCQPNAVLNQQQKCIPRHQRLNNCILAEDEQTCQTCQVGYIISLGRCILKDIENCVDYVVNQTNGDLFCTECDNGYGLNKNVCVKGLFNSCKKIDLQGVCLNCQYGFQLVNLSNDQKYCVPVSSHQNCLAYDMTEFNQKRIQCTQCASNNYILQNLTPQIEVCNQVITIRNCIKYDIKTTFSNSTLQCQECHPNYYLNGNDCFFRRNKIENCLTYELNSELCTSCENTHYLVSSKKYCIKNPTGIDFCRVYANDKLCKTCNTNYFVKDGKCEAVLSTNLLQGCYEYDSNQKCTQCQMDLVMLDNKCLSILAKNCLTLKNTQECLNCQFGFELIKDEKNIVNCVEIVKPLIQNCLVVSDTKPFSCLQCLEHHYFDSQKCVAIEKAKIIENCETYENSVSCAKCQKYYILSQEKNLCVLEKNRNCDFFQEMDKGFCVQCAPGYKFNKDGQCIELNPENNKNCLIWQNESSLCKICQKGYSMTVPGTCLKTNFTQIQGEILHNENEGPLPPVPGLKDQHGEFSGNQVMFGMIKMLMILFVILN